MRIINYSSEYKLNAPIYGGAADIAAGALLARGATPGTDQGALIKATGTAAVPDILGVLNSKLTYATDTETLANGTTFVTKPVELISPFRVIRIEYDLTSNITCTQAVSTTTLTLTSLEDDIDAGFLYVSAGVGIGQTNFLTAAAAGFLHAQSRLRDVFGHHVQDRENPASVPPDCLPDDCRHEAGEPGGRGRDQGDHSGHVHRTQRPHRPDQPHQTRGSDGP
jgi:hypothetical protein